MAATTAISGKGTTLSYCDTANGTFVVVGQLTEVNHPEVSVDSVDGTHYTSDNGYEEKVSTGWKKIADVTATLEYNKTATTTIFGLVDLPKYWKETYSDGSVWAWFGRLTKLGGNPIPNKDIIKQTIAITPSGALTFTAGA
jgi:hypothetical protein